MYYRNRQSGMTIFGMLLIVFLIVFFTLLTLKLVPPYLNNFKVKSDLANLVKEPGSANLSMPEVVDGLERRFEIDEVSHVHLSKDLKVTAIAGGLSINLAYEVRVPLIYNISAVVDFNDHAEAVGH